MFTIRPTVILKFIILLASLAVTYSAEAKRPRHRPAAPAPPAGPFSTVVIDPGHGGHDFGGIRGQKVLEKVVALDVAKRLRKQLDTAGFRTVMTRTDDSFVSLGRRVAIANAHRDAIFVSIHFNAAPRVGARGIETFYCTSRSKPVADNIQRQLIAFGRTESRGVKHAEFYVLRENGIRAALTECGFLTNPEDTALAVKASYRQRLAEGIAAAIERYRASL